jgi:acyl-CoA synthetase (AMP-forming)/AMP-acid ligase II
VGEVLRANARLFPERVGARDLERAMTFRQWNARACRLANALLGLELAKGERVAVLAYNCVEWLEIYAATAKAGLIAVPVNFRLVGAEIRYIVENCEAAAFIVEDALVETVEQVRSDLSVPARNFIHFGAAKCPPGYRAYEDLLAAARDLEPDVKVAPTDPWTLMYTSGTTGTPKGAIRSHLGSANLSLVTEVEMGLARDDAALLVMPLCHGNSFSSAPSSIAAPCGLRAAASIPSSCALALLAGRHLSVVTAVGDALPRAVLEK